MLSSFRFVGKQDPCVAFLRLEQSVPVAVKIYPQSYPLWGIAFELVFGYTDSLEVQPVESFASKVLQGLGTIESYSSNSQQKIGVSHMSALDWIFTTFFVVLYLFLLFTVCLLTFRKGYIVLGIIGIFIPFLWLIGAILPDKRGSL